MRTGIARHEAFCPRALDGEAEPWSNDRMNRFGVGYIAACTSLWALFFYRAPADVMGPFQEAIHTLPGWKMIASSLGALLLALLVERMIVGAEKSAFRKMASPSASTKRDQITCFLSVFGLLDLLGYVLTLGLPFFLGAKLVLLFPVLQSVQIIKLLDSHVAQMLATVVLADLFMYIGHRMMHSFSALWEIHKYHHSSTEMSVFAAYRNNPFARPIRGLVSAVPVTFLGGDFTSFLFASFVLDFFLFITHSEIDRDWGWIGRWLLISPRTHRIHHALEGTQHRSNYGNTFVIWDRLFGTYMAAENPTKFGVVNSEYNSISIFEEMFASIQRIAALLKRKLS